jgi:hypothetical protein
MRFHAVRTGTGTGTGTRTRTGTRTGGRAHNVTRPPSMRSAWLLIMAASSEARKATAPGRPGQTVRPNAANIMSAIRSDISSSGSETSALIR